MPQASPAELVVLSYLGLDGFPQSCVVERAEPDGSGRIVLTLPAEEGRGPWRTGDHCRVGLLYVDPARPDLAHRVTGVGYPAAGGRLDVLLEGGRAATEVRKAKKSEAPAGYRFTGAGSVLEVAGLSIFYGPMQAVRGLSLEVLRGEIFGLLGPNGAGKTSTLSAIEGLRKPASGAIRLDGIDVLQRPIEAKAKMGVQLQATSFQSSLSIKQILRLFAGLYGVRASDADLDGIISEAGLDAEAAKPFKQLSGGQQQRLSLQVAVIHRPDLLLLDEPTAGLDPQARRQLWGRIEELRKGGGSILLTTHSMEEAQAVCDRVAIMDHGEILTSGPPSELIARHRDDPRVRALAHGDVTLDDVFVGLTGSEIRD
jgi:ABC-2 type transport system ATP-binding protein